MPEPLAPKHGDVRLATLTALSLYLNAQCQPWRNHESIPMSYLCINTASYRRDPN